jgi:arylsulfatase A-like enzyme
VVRRARHQFCAALHRLVGLRAQSPNHFHRALPDLHGVTQTDGLGKMPDDSRMRWLRQGEVPTLGNWFRAAGYDTHYDGKWHISHADLHDADGRVLATNNADGVVDPVAVQRYLDADPLAPFGFSGWVGPEPHGALPGNAGVRRDPLVADRVVAWLTDRYARRRAGDPDALRPFLLVASFVNPHDIVLFPGWVRRSPLKASPLDPPHVPAAPTADEDLASKPAAQIAFREAYSSGYGPAPVIERVYGRNAQRYRDLYYRLHAEVDGPIDRVRRAVSEGGSDNAVLVRTSDHGDLLGAHGGLHQKWFNLYDEATRVPFVIARIGAGATSSRVVTAPTSHVDLVPTLLAAAGVDVTAVAATLAESFSEVHPLPGRDLMPVVDGAAADDDRGRLPDDPRQHPRGRHRRLGGGTAVAADGESTSAAAYPGARARGVELRGPGGPRRRRSRRRRPPVEAGAHLRRPGHLDRTGRSPPRGEWAWRRGVSDEPARRPVGVVRPH